MSNFDYTSLKSPQFVRRLQLSNYFTRSNLIGLLVLWTLIFLAWMFYIQRPDTHTRENTQLFCDGEKMYFTNTLHDNGQPFHCSLLPILRGLQLTDNYIERTPKNKIRSEDVVFLTYASSNHFAESRFMLKKLREHSNNTIIYYDLGLKKNEFDELSNVCNLIVKKINYTVYPNHVKNPLTYAFKPVAIAETIRDYPFIWVLDTSVTFTTTGNPSKLYEDINNGKLEDAVMRYDTGHKIIKFTHPDMYNFLPMRREIAAKQTQKGATLMFLRKSLFTMKFVKWLLLCVLTEDCIAPPGAIISCGSGDIKKKGCHRFDQAAANLILDGLIGKDIAPDVLSPLVNVERGQQDNKKISKLGNC